MRLPTDELARVFSRWIKSFNSTTLCGPPPSISKSRSKKQHRRGCSEITARSAAAYRNHSFDHAMARIER